MSISQQSSDHSIAAVASIFGAVTEWLSSGHLGAALIVGMASGAGVKIGGFVANAVLAKLRLVVNKSDRDKASESERDKSHDKSDNDENQ